MKRRNLKIRNDLQVIKRGYGSKRDSNDDLIGIASPSRLGRESKLSRLIEESQVESSDVSRMGPLINVVLTTAGNENYIKINNQG